MHYSAHVPGYLTELCIGMKIIRGPPGHLASCVIAPALASLYGKGTDLCVQLCILSVCLSAGAGGQAREGSGAAALPAELASAPATAPATTLFTAAAHDGPTPPQHPAAVRASR